MLMKKIFGTLLITTVITLSTAPAQSQSASRRVWPKGDAANNPAPTVPDQAAERVSVAELQTVSQEPQVAEQGSLHDIHERRKKTIVGSWLGTTGGGNKIIQSFTSDGIALNSVQGEVSTNPEVGGVLTPVHGVWQHLGGRQFGVTAMGIFYDINTGHLNGILKAQLVLTLNKAGDEMSGTDKVQILDPDGNVVLTFTGETHYKRIKFERPN
jgi:hypothetical protein